MKADRIGAFVTTIFFGVLQILSRSGMIGNFLVFDRIIKKGEERRKRRERRRREGRKGREAGLPRKTQQRPIA
jgi:hypothetical protein